MLRFNVLFLFFLKNFQAFQYILCYGSTETFLKIGVVIKISIHPMLRFNYTKKEG